MSEQIRDQLRKSALALSVGYGAHWALLWGRVRDRIVIDSATPTASISADGVLRIGPAYWAKLTPAERIGVLAHELLHAAMLHFMRAQSIGLLTTEGRPVDWRLLRLWNVAADIAINHCLRVAGLTLPEGVLTTPTEYTGSLDAESIFCWLKRQQSEQAKEKESDEGESDNDSAGEDSVCGYPSGGGADSPTSRGDAEPGSGCGVSPPEQQGQGAPDWGQIASEARALATQEMERGGGVGQGASAIVHALAPAPARIPWERVIGRAYASVSAIRGKDSPTYSKASRRDHGPLVVPGYVSNAPMVAHIVDVSGSMGDAPSRIAKEIGRAMKTWPGTKTYIIAHTDRVVWHGWVSSEKEILPALAFTGGTCPKSAYELLCSLSHRFDAVCHFTDCEFYAPWPEWPRRARLMIGAYGDGVVSPMCEPPVGATVIACDDPRLAR